MAAASPATYLEWLVFQLSRQENRLSSLLCRLSGFTAGQKSDFALFQKFMGLMDQIAVEHEEERRLLRRIEAVEIEHLNNRRNHRLKEAEPQTANEHPGIQIWVLVFWLLFMRGAINHRKQGLTVG